MALAVPAVTLLTPVGLAPAGLTPAGLAAPALAVPTVTVTVVGRRGLPPVAVALGHVVHRHRRATGHHDRRRAGRDPPHRTPAQPPPRAARLAGGLRLRPALRLTLRLLELHGLAHCAHPLLPGPVPGPCARIMVGTACPALAEDQLKT